ncbi:MAG: transketolase [Candidatus Omnitrophica bacterium]|nr:transketolase [Candidatus Omnitrophota bacterium]
MEIEQDYRREVLDQIVTYFREDERYHLLICDTGFGVINQLKEEFPKRIINCGIMEQGTIGIAAGMSTTGLIPVVFSIINFLVYRAIEQVRNDVILQNLNVKFIGTGANDYFKFLGPSHCCGTNDIRLMELINMKTYDPYSAEKSFDVLVKDWLCSEQAGYLRV